MILIIGGAFQGKCAYAVKTYDLRPEDICDLAREDPVPGRRCYLHLEALSRRETDLERYLPLFEEAIVVSREVGGGIVPMDAAERAWREAHGTFLQTLARRSRRVVRILCGLEEILK